MTARVRLAVVVLAVLTTASVQGGPTAAQQSDIPVSDTVPPFETLPVETECEVEPRTKVDLLARIDTVEASPKPPGTSTGPLTAVADPASVQYPDISIDGARWIDSGELVPDHRSLPWPSAAAVEGVNRTLQALNACGGFLEFPFRSALFTDEGLDQELRVIASFGVGVLRGRLDDPPVNDHEATDPTGTHVYSTVAMSDGRVAAVISITSTEGSSSDVFPYVVVLEDTSDTWKVDWLLYASHLPYIDPSAQRPDIVTPTPVR